MHILSSIQQWHQAEAGEALEIICTMRTHLLSIWRAQSPKIQHQQPSSTAAGVVLVGSRTMIYSMIYGNSGTAAMLA